MILCADPGVCSDHPDQNTYPPPEPQACSLSEQPPRPLLDHHHRHHHNHNNSTFVPMAATPIAPSSLSGSSSASSSSSKQQLLEIHVVTPSPSCEPQEEHLRQHQHQEGSRQKAGTTSSTTTTTTIEQVNAIHDIRHTDDVEDDDNEDDDERRQQQQQAQQPQRQQRIHHVQQHLADEYLLILEHVQITRLDRNRRELKVEICCEKTPKESWQFLELDVDNDVDGSSFSSSYVSVHFSSEDTSSLEQALFSSGLLSTSQTKKCYHRSADIKVRLCRNNRELWLVELSASGFDELPPNLYGKSLLSNRPFTLTMPFYKNVLFIFWDLEATGLDVESDDIIELGSCYRLVSTTTMTNPLLTHAGGGRTIQQHLPSMASPSIASPSMATPSMATPSMASPTMASPAMAPSSMASPSNIAVQGEFVRMVQTDIEIPLAVQKLTRITPELLQRQAVPLRQVVDEWHCWIGKLQDFYRPTETWLIAHNGNMFDLPLFLNQEATKLNQMPGSFFKMAKITGVVDSVILSRRLDFGCYNNFFWLQHASHRLGDLYREAFHCEIPGAHDALADSMALASIMEQEPFLSAVKSGRPIGWTAEEFIQDWKKFAAQYAIVVDDVSVASTQAPESTSSNSVLSSPNLMFVEPPTRSVNRNVTSASEITEQGNTVVALGTTVEPSPPPPDDVVLTGESKNSSYLEKHRKKCFYSNKTRDNRRRTNAMQQLPRQRRSPSITMAREKKMCFLESLDDFPPLPV